MRQLSDRSNLPMRQISYLIFGAVGSIMVLTVAALAAAGW